MSNELTFLQLRSVSLFAGCDNAELREFSDRSAEIRLAAGEVLVRAGTVAAEVPILLDGYAEAAVDGRPTIVLGPGAVIGGPEALDGALQPMTVTAQTPIVVRVISAANFSEIVASVPPLAMAMIRQLGGRTRTVLDELVCARQGFVSPNGGSPSSAGARLSSGVASIVRD
jgi:CRP-like cAMP-binding protein